LGPNNSAAAAGGGGTATRGSADRENDHPAVRVDALGLAAQARGGDLAARNAVIERCLPYVTFLATTYAKLLSAEYLELVQVGSLAITEKIDKALTMQSPVTYLGMIARYAMRNYAHIHRRAIIVPKNAPTLDVIESLDKPVPDMDNTVLGDLIPEPSQVPLAEEKDYTALYQAIERLSPQRQFVITHHFGLHDTAPESMVEITRAMGARDRNAADRSLGRWALRPAGQGADRRRGARAAGEPPRG